MRLPLNQKIYADTHPLGKQNGIGREDGRARKQKQRKIWQNLVVVEEHRCVCGVARTAGESGKAFFSESNARP